MAKQQHMKILAALALQSGGYQTQESEPSAGDYAEFKTLKLDPKPNMDPQSGHTGRMGRRGPRILHGIDVAFEGSFDFKPSGTAGTASRMAPMFSHGIWDEAVALATTTTINGDWANGYTGDVTSAAGMSVGMVIPFETSPGSGVYECALIGDISTNTLTLATPLSFSPLDTSAVGKSNTHPLDNDDLTSALTMWSSLSELADTGWGLVASKFNIGWGSNAQPNCSFDGFGRGYAHGGETTLAAILDAPGAVTTVELTDPDEFEEGQIVIVGTERILLGERNASDNKFYNSTRNVGGGLAAHSISDPITFYAPTPTLLGAGIPSPLCKMRIAAASTAATFFEGPSGDLAIDGGLVPDEQHFGDKYTVPSYGKTDEDFMPLYSVQGKLEQSFLKRYRQMMDGDQFGVVTQFGNAPGKICGFLSPYVEPNYLKEGRGDGRGSIAIQQQFAAMGTYDGLDAIYYFEC